MSNHTKHRRSQILLTRALVSDREDGADSNTYVAEAAYRLGLHIDF